MSCACIGAALAGSASCRRQRAVAVPASRDRGRPGRSPATALAAFGWPWGNNGKATPEPAPQPAELGPGRDDGLVGYSRSLLPKAPPRLSRSDEQFAADGVEFVFGLTEEEMRGRVHELNDLFAKVGFPRREADTLELALRCTHTILSARALRGTRITKQGAVLGFARATSDGVFVATIWDVAVLPAWQRSGLGRGLMERLTASLVRREIYDVNLYAEPGVVGMYRRMGFAADLGGARGMALRLPAPEFEPPAISI